ncbi:hypothetical protein ruthe_02613 [Rubellimicrobium thermophilum DSM 16684]|uniref:Uncharacterized protein n=1 Tax=Rubellimicrobium thermophilum DSM 16684 TaxID=1123069 RepID=S9S0Q4_9RHOB|nr:hypothetical protein ruthe_02613 [Rubellimicrobium thermophilum DSM 16684]
MSRHGARRPRAQCREMLEHLRPFLEIAPDGMRIEHGQIRPAVAIICRLHAAEPRGKVGQGGMGRHGRRRSGDHGDPPGRRRLEGRGALGQAGHGRGEIELRLPRAQEAAQPGLKKAFARLARHHILGPAGQRGQAQRPLSRRDEDDRRNIGRPGLEQREILPPLARVEQQQCRPPARSRAGARAGSAQTSSGRCARRTASCSRARRGGSPSTIRMWPDMIRFSALAASVS